MERFINLSAAMFLISGLLFGQYAVAQSDDVTRATMKTYKSLTLDFDLEGTVNILGGCSDQQGCKTQMSEQADFNQVRVLDRQGFVIETFGAASVDPGASIILYVFYFEKNYDQHGNGLRAIDVGLNPDSNSVQRKVKDLIINAHNTRSVGNDLIYSLGKLALEKTPGDGGARDLLPVLDVMVINHAKKENDYSIRYIIEWEPKMLEYRAEADRINDYFVNAVRVYAGTGEEASRVAILAAAKVAASLQRAWMISYLRGVAIDLEAMAEQKEKAASKKLLSLANELEQKEWTIDDIIQEKQRLKQFNKDYENALNEADPSVFSRYYPNLFKD